MTFLLRRAIIFTREHLATSKTKGKTFFREKKNAFYVRTCSPLLLNREWFLLFVVRGKARRLSVCIDARKSPCRSILPRSKQFELERHCIIYVNFAIVVCFREVSLPLTITAACVCVQMTSTIRVRSRLEDKQKFLFLGLAGSLPSIDRESCWLRRWPTNFFHLIERDGFLFTLQLLDFIIITLHRSQKGCFHDEPSSLLCSWEFIHEQENRREVRVVEGRGKSSED